MNVLAELEKAIPKMSMEQREKAIELLQVGRSALAQMEAQKDAIRRFFRTHNLGEAKQLYEECRVILQERIQSSFSFTAT